MTTTTQPRSDVYTRVTAKIIADLEQGVITWQRPWMPRTPPETSSGRAVLTDCPTGG